MRILLFSNLRIVFQQHEHSEVLDDCLRTNCPPSRHQRLDLVERKRQRSCLSPHVEDHPLACHTHQLTDHLKLHLIGLKPTHQADANSYVVALVGKIELASIAQAEEGAIGLSFTRGFSEHVVRYIEAKD